MSRGGMMKIRFSGHGATGDQPTLTDLGSAKLNVVRMAWTFAATGAG
jgi:hypothetical protein